MKYYQLTRVIKENETLSINQADSDEVILYDRLGDVEYYGVNSSDYTRFLAMQNPECNIVEKQFADISDILQNCPMNRHLNDLISKRIRQQYTSNDEFKMLNLDKTDPEYIAYNTYRNMCRAEGRVVKIEKGLVLS